MVETADVLVHNFRPSVAAPPGHRLRASQGDQPAAHLLQRHRLWRNRSAAGKGGLRPGPAGDDRHLQFSGHGKGAADRLWVHRRLLRRIDGGVWNRGGVASSRAHRARGSMSGYRCFGARWRCSRRGSSGPKAKGATSGRDMRSGGITGLHPTKEGYIYLSANTPAFLVEPLRVDRRAGAGGKRALRHGTQPRRARGEIVPKVRAALLARTALEWEEIFGERVPCSAVRTIEDMFEHPQVRAEELVADFDHPLVGRYRGLRSP